MENYTQVADLFVENAEQEEDRFEEDRFEEVLAEEVLEASGLEASGDFVESLLMGEANDLLINDLYSKERAARVELFGVQLDEMWSFVQKKENKVWIWLALNPANR